jgi:nucleotide-binding universal stress UspA family protein
MPRVVVGIDGSEHAQRALRWAVEEARLRGVTLTVVHVAPVPFDLSAPILAHQPTEDELRSLGRELIDETLQDLDVVDLDVERVALIGNAASQLCEAARGADLLVIGSRGLGGFRGLLVGSVTQQVVAHAPCPILVVVPQDR